MAGNIAGVADYWAFVLAVIVFLAIPGPGNLALITSTSQGGRRAGFAATVGLLAGDQILLWLAVAGVATALAAMPAVFTFVQWLGAAYLAYLGLRMVFSKPGGQAVFHMNPSHYFRQATLITVLNPKAILFYMAFFPLFVDQAAHQGLLTFFVMAATVAVLTALYCISMVLLTHRFAQRMRASPRVSNWLERVAGTLLLAFGIKLALGR